MVGSTISELLFSQINGIQYITNTTRGWVCPQVENTYHMALYLSIWDINGIYWGYNVYIPIGSMYGIYTNIGGILMANVTIYSIHGSYGIVLDKFDHDRTRCDRILA
jgi:hypothetical protein